MKAQPSSPPRKGLQMRVRKPSDDKVSAFDIVVLVVFLVVIGGIVAWGLGLL